MFATATLSAPANLKTAMTALLNQFNKAHVAQRIWQRDHTLWKPVADEISNRLGWLDSPITMPAHVQEINQLADLLIENNFTHALLLGMGGSSLAPEVFRLTFGITAKRLDLQVIDSTHPGAIQAAAALDPQHTLYLPATKSGGTIETLSFLKYFYTQASQKLGQDKAGEHFVAITDPDSGLATLARQLDFRHCFLNDPNIGGRYSALSFFGLVAAGLIGVDLDRLLDSANAMRTACQREDDNPSALLGAYIGAGAQLGRDKLTLITSPTVDPFGVWVEQLIAESTGKENKGILPVNGETVSIPQAYEKDRLFIYLHYTKDSINPAVTALVKAGLPVLYFALDDLHHLGGEFLRWEIATSIVGHILAINPFDQPNVETAKILARDMVSTYELEGTLPTLPPQLEEAGLQLFSDTRGHSLKEIFEEFLGQVQAGISYISLQAYIQPTTATTAALQTLRLSLRDHYKVATTVGYGPRFLHSTGQLHKGDAGNGFFIQFTDDTTPEEGIPNSPGSTESTISFGVLIAAQAQGDRQALQTNGRPVLRLHLGKDTVADLRRILTLLYH